MLPLGEIRRNPFTGEFIIINEKRLSRPIITDSQSRDCPFCPSSQNKHPGLPDNFDAIALENLFPALQLPSFTVGRMSLELPEFDVPFLGKASNWGKCEVILYSDQHDVEFHYLPLEKAVKVTKLWQQRMNDLARNHVIKYVFIFENHGKDVGVTIFHPHGQIYALPFVPPRIQVMLNNSRHFYQKRGTCLQCEVLIHELNDKKRIITENDHFLAMAPHYATLPHEIHVVPKRHVSDLRNINDNELTSFTTILQDVRKRYDLLFQTKFTPNYMMMFFSKPVNIHEEFDTIDAYHHFRVEFISLDRDDQNLKYRAAVETGLNVWTNDVSPETVAKKMRDLSPS